MNTLLIVVTEKGVRGRTKTSESDMGYALSDAAAKAYMKADANKGPGN